ncbi:MAG TPA: YetF domain-containing protein [Candidatus Binatia bacterium]|nr:YetF domain-containing protein [Candidatus Binatia bacterium]
MNPVTRAAVIYFFLLVMFRLAGKRSFSQLTSFDFVLLLIIAEAIQQGLIGEDFSITQALLLIVTLVGLDIAMSLLKQRFPWLERFVDGLPLVVVENGVPVKHFMDKARVDEKDVLVAARENHGLERMDQIKYAVLERNGGISIIPKETSS